MLILLDVMLRRLVRRGDLTFIDANGLSHRYGDGAGPPLVVRVRDASGRVASGSRSAAGPRREPTCEGGSDVEGGRIYDLLELILSGTDARPHARSGPAVSTLSAT